MLLISVLLISSIGLFVLAGFLISRNMKIKQIFLNLQNKDMRFVGAKLFNFINSSFILISESGYIALKSLSMYAPKIINIREVIGFEVITNEKPAANFSSVAGLLFGGAGAIVGGPKSREQITKMSFLFRINDFKHPKIEIPIIASTVKKGSFEHLGITSKINDVISSLEAIEKNYKAA